MSFDMLISHSKIGTWLLFTRDYTNMALLTTRLKPSSFVQQQGMLQT